MTQQRRWLFVFVPSHLSWAIYFYFLTLHRPYCSCSILAMAASSKSFVSRGSSLTSSPWPKMLLPPTDEMTMDETDKWIYGQMNYVTPDTQLVSTHRDLAGSDGNLEGATFDPCVVKVHNCTMLACCLTSRTCIGTAFS